MTGKLTIDERAHAYLWQRFWRDDQVLADARERFQAVGPLIEVPSETGALLATLVRASGARRVLEIGTLFGYSAVWMARALPVGGQLDTLELVDEHADMADQLFEQAGVADRIILHRGSAHQTLKHFTGHYDLVFIDADKEGYVDYLDHAVSLVRSGGLIVADNMAQGGRIADLHDTSASVDGIRRFLEVIIDHPQLDSNVLPIGDGVSVSVKH